MKKQTIKLDCGHEVEVIAIDIRRTYGEFLAGKNGQIDHHFPV
jgi:hypothetical protein